MDQTNILVRNEQIADFYILYTQVIAFRNNQQIKEHHSEVDKGTVHIDKGLVYKDNGFLTYTHTTDKRTVYIEKVILYLDNGTFVHPPSHNR